MRYNMWPLRRKTVHLGGSTAVTIPPEVQRHMDFKAGVDREVEWVCSASGDVVLRKARGRK